MESRDIHFTAGPKGDDLYEWVAALPGPDDTPYAGGTFATANAGTLPAMCADRLLPARRRLLPRPPLPKRLPLLPPVRHLPHARLPLQHKLLRQSLHRLPHLRVDADADGRAHPRRHPRPPRRAEPARPARRRGRVAVSDRPARARRGRGRLDGALRVVGSAGHFFGDSCSRSHAGGARGCARAAARPVAFWRLTRLAR